MNLFRIIGLAAMGAWILPTIPVGEVAAASNDLVGMPQPVLVTASVSADRREVVLHWEPLPSGNSLEIRVYRKPVDAHAWGTAIATLPGEAVLYRDTEVETGSRFEYRVTRRTSRRVTEHGFIEVAVDAPVVHDRGIVVLVVDASIAGGIEAELRRLRLDLAGDGWTVDQLVFPRGLPAYNPGRRFDRGWRGRDAYADQVRSLKEAIRARHARDPDRVRAVFLLGHLPVPYAGHWAPDGHAGGAYGNHIGAQPVDVYYGEMDAEWTDQQSFPLVSREFRNFNVAGDGKFDKASFFRNPVELMVGRVDLSKLPAFRESEVALLRRYLDKNHRYRSGQTAYPRRALIENRLRFNPNKDNGWFRSFWAMFGPNGVHTFPHVKYSVTVPRSGSYFMWCRVSRTRHATSIWISEEGKAERSFELGASGPELGASGPELGAESGMDWEWVRVDDGGGGDRPRRFRFGGGEVGFYFRPRQSGVVWDQLLLTTDEAFRPPVGTPAADPPPARRREVEVVVEAESGAWTLPVIVVSDPTAGGGHYLSAPTPVHDDVRFFSTLRDQPYLWGCAFSTGHEKGLNNVGDIGDFAGGTVKTPFTLFYGSWFGDWDAPDNFLRGALGGSDTLASCWLGPEMNSNRSVAFHRLATGATIGAATLLTQFCPYKTFSDLPMPPPFDAATCHGHVSLMGDPTLRMDVTRPPTNPRMIRRGFGRVDLSWDAPSGEGVDGYHVYAARDANGPFRLISGPERVRGPSYAATDPGPVYQVRAVARVMSASGSFWNTSQGLFFGVGDR